MNRARAYLALARDGHGVYNRIREELMKDEVSRDNSVGDMSPARVKSRKAGIQSQISRTIRTIQSTGLSVCGVEICDDRILFKTESKKGFEVPTANSCESAAEKWFRDHG